MRSSVRVMPLIAAACCCALLLLRTAACCCLLLLRAAACCFLLLLAAACCWLLVADLLRLLAAVRCCLVLLVRRLPFSSVRSLSHSGVSVPFSYSLAFAYTLWLLPLSLPSFLFFPFSPSPSFHIPPFSLFLLSLLLSLSSSIFLPSYLLFSPPPSLTPPLSSAPPYLLSPPPSPPKTKTIMRGSLNILLVVGETQ